MLFGRDRSNRDIDGERLINRLQTKAFQEQMAKHNVEFVAAKQGNKNHTITLYLSQPMYRAFIKGCRGDGINWGRIVYPFV